MEQNNSNKEEIVGVWVFADADELEDFFLRKALREKELGHVMNEKELHDFLVEMKDSGLVDGVVGRGNRDNVKAVLTEHFNTKNIRKMEDLKE